MSVISVKLLLQLPCKKLVGEGEGEGVLHSRCLVEFHSIQRWGRGYFIQDILWWTSIPFRGGGGGGSGSGW